MSDRKCLTDRVTESVNEGVARKCDRKCDRTYLHYYDWFYNEIRRAHFRAHFRSHFLCVVFLWRWGSCSMPAWRSTAMWRSLPPRPAAGPGACLMLPRGRPPASSGISRRPAVPCHACRRRGRGVWRVRVGRDVKRSTQGLTLGRLSLFTQWKQG